MIVEYVGLPGAGKSFLAANHAKLDNLPYIHPLGRAQKIIWTMIFILLHPILFYRFIELTIRSSGGINIKFDRVFRYLCNSCAREMLARQTKKALLDEGLIQYYLGVYEAPVDPKTIEADVNILKPLIHNRRVVLVEAEKDVRLQRMNKRGRLPRSRYGSEYQDKFMCALEHNYPIIKSQLQTMFGSDTLDNTN